MTKRPGRPRIASYQDIYDIFLGLKNEFWTIEEDNSNCRRDGNTLFYSRYLVDPYLRARKACCRRFGISERTFRRVLESRGEGPKTHRISLKKMREFWRDEKMEQRQERRIQEGISMIGGGGSDRPRKRKS